MWCVGFLVLSTRGTPVHAAPVVSNVTAAQTPGTREVAITYSLADTDPTARFFIKVQASKDNGASWTPITRVTGALSGVAPGEGRQIKWDAGSEWPGLLLPQVKVRLIADSEMALIPAGTFMMGSLVESIDGTDKSDGITDATPHQVTLSAFYLAKTETTYAEWVAVRDWARDAARGANSYDFDATLGSGKGDVHPVQSVNWYDAAKWCNAKSEREGLTPVYYTDEAQTNVYRTGEVNVTNARVKWRANGYRLPTEAEWEFAARGGASGLRFPWGDTITHAQANYTSGGNSAYDVNPNRGRHPTYWTGGEPYTSPVGVFAANGYGLSDMVGNVLEWTWDWYGSYGSGSVSDPRGAASGTSRVIRGGAWGAEAYSARSAIREINFPVVRFGSIGFRLARSVEAPGAPTDVVAIAGSAQAVVSFTAPRSVGFSAITSYTVTAKANSGELVSAAGTASPITVTGLSPFGTYTFSVTARNSGATGLASAETGAVVLSSPMVLIPAGTYTMGSVVESIEGADKSDGISPTGNFPSSPNSSPHQVTLSSFYLAKTETTYAEWVAVRNWARDPARGAGMYDFGATLGGGIGDTHPVHSVSWYDVVKWCNAKSEREGLTPVYYTNDARTTVYRSGSVNVTNAQVNWEANGYRLPTEAEWEYAARGGLSGKRFPWGDTITHTEANYNSTANYSYDVSSTRGYHPTYASGIAAYASGFAAYTQPVGAFGANGFGLTDMAGNVWEWCWDWWANYGSAAVTNPRGADSAFYIDTLRVKRGGASSDDAAALRLALRGANYPSSGTYNGGFRPARSR